jgi:hypothetical protein
MGMRPRKRWLPEEAGIRGGWQWAGGDIGRLLVCAVVRRRESGYDHAEAEAQEGMAGCAGAKPTRAVRLISVRLEALKTKKDVLQVLT